MVFKLKLGCRLIDILVSQVLIGYLLQQCDATHFRGAHFWWEPNANDPNKINLTFRIAWRRDYSEQTLCTMETINTGSLIGPVDAGYIMCVTNCNFRVGDMDFRCTDYSIQEGWTSGLRTHVVTFPKPGFYRIGWQGRSWLEEVIRGANTDWEFLIGVNTMPRSDTGVMNSSPKSAVGTILRIQEGCNQTLSIPVSDPNGDIVQCRWSIDHECGGICGPPPGFVLYQQTCKLEFQSSAKKGKYALAIQIEDFKQTDTTLNNPLSSIPLQFLVEIYPTTTGNVSLPPTKEQCNLAPVFLDPTAKNGQCFAITVGTTSTQQIIARTKDINTSIREINTVSSNGMTKTAVERYGSLLTDYFVNVTWAPIPGQVGDKIFCFTAVDSTGISSEQRCIYLSISASSPMATKASYEVEQQTIHIQFNQSIQMPMSSKTLELYDSSDNKILLVNTNNSQVVSYTNTSLIVQVPKGANINGQYYILLPKGAVRGNLRCGPQSIAVTDKSILAFTAVLATTAPQITTGIIETTAHPSTSNPTTVDASTSNLTTVGTSNLTTVDPSTSNITTADRTGLTTDNTTGVQVTIASGDTNLNNSSSLGSQPGVTPSSLPLAENENNYMWLIILVVVVVVLFIFLIILAIIIRWRLNTAKSGEYARKERQEEYLRNLQYQTKIVGYDGPYAPNFHDIEVKFR